MESDGADLLVIGGGPAGSTAAAIAAQRGLRVLLLEAAEHPREHVGESLLPGVIPILGEMGALEDVESAGFVRKTGSTHWNWGRSSSWDLWFADSEAYDHAWLVNRARFDAILINAARQAGARVIEGAAVRELLWDGTRLRGVRWAQRGERSTHVAEPRWTVDASGSAALIARDRDLRSIIPGLKHQALWAHYEHVGRLPPPRHEQALFVAADRHWAWFFPLSAERSSVGIVQLDSQIAHQSLEDTFEEAITACEGLRDVMGSEARRVTPVRFERDWSYRMQHVAGPGWLLTGDASGFIDPVLSTGVLLAMHSGWHAGRLVGDTLRGELAEDSVAEDYSRQHKEIFDDLLRIVRFFYQRNLHKEDYFWESKRILLTRETEIRPHKAFLVLTSGLVDNLALAEVSSTAWQRRKQRVESAGHTGEAREPEELGFVCIHLRHDGPKGRAALYFLIEPADPAEPTLFRTTNWHLNCLAPKYDNDPIMEPSVAPHLRALHERIRALDTEGGESLASFWRRARQDIAEVVRGLPEPFELVRVFGE